ncbi:molybdopterin molybdotransferase MoeA [Streptomyces zagrosensis]|uniref:molybdopterin molybdotransferase n=1 Tax=Streptomyces zagrosensis TaxID=1042984 RepID=A0A7W9Q6I3_9ACTN|nr:molybdopterin-binding protein [Streptomyces zagrosensis]MBB5934033.1 molybdenum cofactor synthesis domain-containing protein [Streptomyces zagrosensis]
MTGRQRADSAHEKSDESDEAALDRATDEALAVAASGRAPRVERDEWDGWVRWVERDEWGEGAERDAWGAVAEAAEVAEAEAPGPDTERGFVPVSGRDRHRDTDPAAPGSGSDAVSAASSVSARCADADSDVGRGLGNGAGTGHDGAREPETGGCPGEAGETGGPVDTGGTNEAATTDGASGSVDTDGAGGSEKANGPSETHRPGGPGKAEGTGEASGSGGSSPGGTGELDGAAGGAGGSHGESGTGGAGGSGDADGHGEGRGSGGERARHGGRPVSWPEARTIASRAVDGPLPAAPTPLGEALGRVLAEPLTALTDLPPFDTSAMDGWAIAGPGPWRLPVCSQGVLAGHARPEPLEDGRAVRIATGARTPLGATAVLRSEHGTTRDGRAPRAGRAGESVRPDPADGHRQTSRDAGSIPCADCTSTASSTTSAGSKSPSGTETDGPGPANASGHASSTSSTSNDSNDSGSGSGSEDAYGNRGGHGTNEHRHGHEHGQAQAQRHGTNEHEHGRGNSNGEADGWLYASAAHPVLPGQDIRPRGQECGRGDQLLPAGTLVTPAVLGLAAAAGYDELMTVRRPWVEILVLGDELLRSGLPHDGLIRDALGPMLGPWLQALGADVLATRWLGDDAEALCAAVANARADLVVTTGGTAGGPVDHVHPVLRRLEARLLVDGVAVRPGHPMLLARLDEHRHLVGLPGNPLAAVSGLLTLAEPLLRSLAARPQPQHRPAADPRAATSRATQATQAALSDVSRGGQPDAPWPTHRAQATAFDAPVVTLAPLAADVPGHPRDTRLVPTRHHAGAAVPAHFNGPAMLRGVAVADGLAVIPPGGASRGAEVEVMGLPWAGMDGIGHWPGTAHSKAYPATEASAAPPTPCAAATPAPAVTPAPAATSASTPSPAAGASTCACALGQPSAVPDSSIPGAPGAQPGIPTPDARAASSSLTRRPGDDTPPKARPPGGTE